MVRGQQALTLFEQIMGKTTGLLKVQSFNSKSNSLIYFFIQQKNLETFVADCYDAIALFLCFHLLLRYKIMCHKRCVPALDDYWDNLERIILMRFEYVFRLNIASIRDCDPTKFNLEMGPHYVMLPFFFFFIFSSMFILDHQALCRIQCCVSRNQRKLSKRIS